jgi:hypothetical protein
MNTNMYIDQFLSIFSTEKVMLLHLTVGGFITKASVLRTHSRLSFVDLTTFVGMIPKVPRIESRHGS